ncbi:transcriptional regulator [Enterobacter mori]|uniref:HVO_A0114 family putative DNA-binding protein n=1 Tax=Enterobacter mori TaxID=539813 RepID=UPI003B843EBE
MSTLIIRVMPTDASFEDAKQSFAAVMSGQAVNTPFTLTFPDVESLAKTMLAAGRLQIINAMTGAGAMSIRELSRRIGRDFRGVHRDVQSLLNGGVIDHDEDGKIIFPYSAIHFDFTLGQEAA